MHFIIVYICFNFYVWSLSTGALLLSRELCCPRWEQIPVALWRIHYGTWLTYTLKRVTAATPLKRPLSSKENTCWPGLTLLGQARYSHPVVPHPQKMLQGLGATWLRQQPVVWWSSPHLLKLGPGSWNVTSLASRYGGTACLRAWQRSPHFG